MSKLANGEDRRQVLYSHMRALNSQFFGWVQEQAQKHPVEDWSDGVQDYLDYRKQLLSEFADCFDKEKPQASGLPSSNQHSSTATQSQTTSNSHSLFGSLNNAKAAVPSSSIFGAAPTSSIPGFGSAAGTATSFGAPSSAPVSFVPLSSPMGAPNEGAGEEDDEGASEAAQASYQPEVQAAGDALGAVLFKAKAKALVLVNKVWERKAVGLLTLRKPPTGRPFVTIGTDAGRSLLTVSIPAKAKINGSSNAKVYGVTFSGAYTLPEGDDAQKVHQGNLMFQVAADKGAELKAHLEKVAST